MQTVTRAAPTHLLELLQPTKLLLNSRLQLSIDQLSSALLLRRQIQPKQRVVDMPTAVKLDSRLASNGSLDIVLGKGIGEGLLCSIEVVDVRVVVLGVVDLHDLSRNCWLKGIVVVGELGEGVLQAQGAGGSGSAAAGGSGHGAGESGADHGCDVSVCVRLVVLVVVVVVKDRSFDGASRCCLRPSRCGENGPRGSVQLDPFPFLTLDPPVQPTTINTSSRGAAAMADSLALDWFASTSRAIDALEAQQTRVTESKRRRGQAAAAAVAAQQDEEPASLLPESIREGNAIPSRKEVLEVLQSLSTSASTATASSASSADLSRVTLAVYALALDDLFHSADRLQDATWYWSTIEDSTWSALSYLVQTLPSRLVLLARESYRILVETTNSATSAQGPPRINRQTVAATVAQLRKTPDVVVGALWPHSVDASIAGDVSPSSGNVTASSSSSSTRSSKALAGPLLLLRRAKRLSPLSLTIHEAAAKRALLDEQRDVVAQQLGALTLTALGLPSANGKQPKSEAEAQEECQRLIEKLQTTLGGASDEEDGRRRSPRLQAQRTQQQASIQTLLDVATRSGSASHHRHNATSPAPLGLSPPSSLSLIWPRLLLYPTLLLLTLRLASNNRDALAQALVDGRETLRGFVRNWLVQPVSELLETIRGGEAAGDEGSSSIVTKEGRKADLESLERMVTQYALDKGHISPSDAARREALRSKVREGDLDVVMLAYEDQLKSPLKSLAGGSLPRLLLIQVQKAKYDLAVAMGGIDHLLKSQALLFGAVGIAPAMGIVWGGVKVGQWVVRGRTSEGARRGGVARLRGRAWGSMRLVDRMLTHEGLREGGAAAGAAAEAEKAYGNALLELAALRKAGAGVLTGSTSGRGHRRSNHATKKRLRAGSLSSRSADSTSTPTSPANEAEARLAAFLEDVRDLESAAARRATAGIGSGSAGSMDGDKADEVARRAVERMWRCWGSTLFVPAVGGEGK